MIKKIMTIAVAAITFSTTATAGENQLYHPPADQLTCLAKNIYFEGRNQSTIGQLAIGLVTLNRVRDTRFPNTICDVVYQAKRYRDGRIKRHKCQFSWFCDGKSDRIKEHEAYKVAVDNAVQAYTWWIDGEDFTKAATHYHTRAVSPSWSRDLQLIGVVDDHIFYRWSK
ncbi:MAG: cell wall hydrolase [Muricauda sp. TMED12]|nr:MAG: cell wall hydrolase [Muricauda sp. TMED12]